MCKGQWVDHLGVSMLNFNLAFDVDRTAVEWHISGISFSSHDVYSYTVRDMHRIVRRGLHAHYMT